jgi:hypothetical protein
MLLTLLVYFTHKLIKKTIFFEQVAVKREAAVTKEMSKLDADKKTSRFETITNYT